MPGTQPTVEMAMRRAEMPMPSGWLIVPQASSTASRFCIGSPMPMKTTLVSRAPCDSDSRPARTTWSTISDAVRLRPGPIAPVAQNLHPSAQPTWLDTHTVRRPSACAIRTASTTAPSTARRPHFTVPSRDSTRASGVRAQNGSDSSRRSRSAAGSVLTSDHPSAPERWASMAWRAR